MRNLPAFILLSLVACFEAGFLTAECAGQPTPNPAAVEAVYETVVRYQIESWELKAASYCVEINGRDAQDVLLGGLHPLPVKRASMCKEHTDKLTKMMNVIDRKSKKAAVIFDLGSIHWISDSEVEVEGGYVCATLCMASGVYHAIRGENGWGVTRFEVHVIS